MKTTIYYLTILLSGTILITSCNQQASHLGFGEEAVNSYSYSDIQQPDIQQLLEFAQAPQKEKVREVIKKLMQRKEYEIEKILKEGAEGAEGLEKTLNRIKNSNIKNREKNERCKALKKAIEQQQDMMGDLENYAEEFIIAPLENGKQKLDGQEEEQRFLAMIYLFAVTVCKVKKNIQRILRNEKIKLDREVADQRKPEFSKASKKFFSKNKKFFSKNKQ